MATERILLIEHAGLAADARAAVQAIPNGPDLLAMDDGAKGIGAFTKLASAGAPPVLVVLDEALPRISGRATARAIRAVERACDLPPTAILVYSEGAADADLKAFLAEVTRAVQMPRKPSASPEERQRRIGTAIQRLLAQVRGA